MHIFGRGEARTPARAAAGLLLWLMLASWTTGGLPVRAQVAVSPVSDTVYYADGTAASGKVLISWNSFTTATGISVPAGSTSVSLTNGKLNVSLAPNGGATPLGSYYTVVYHLNDGSTSREYWTIPASTTALSLSAVRASVLPTSVATQTVSKQYVDQAIARAQLTGGSTAATGDGSGYVLKTGDTMTGALTLPGDPVSALQAADKNYVDTLIAGLQAGLGQKVSLVPSGTQTVTQPTGTTLQVNSLNGILHAKQYQSQQGNDGVTNALTSADCANGCTVVADPGYAGIDAFSLRDSQSKLTDERGGALDQNFLNPQSPRQNFSSAETLTNNVTITPQASGALGRTTLQSSVLQLTENALAGGNNVFPQTIPGAPIPYFKSTYGATNTFGVGFTQGQHVLDSHQQDCYGVGDCLLGSQFLYSSGGNRDNSDEGTHPFDIQIAEHSTVFRGTCTTGCSTGSTQVQITATNDAGTQGEGRYLIDKAAGKTISTGTLTGGSTTGSLASAQFSGTSFPVSTFFSLGSTALSQSTNVSPGTVNVTIQTSGVPAGYSTNTASAPAASGVACVVDIIPGADDFEMARYTVTDGTHIRLQLLKPHGLGATVAMGGLCGYGLEQTVDTVNGIRQLFPVVGSSSGTSLYYAGLGTKIVGQTGITGAYANIQLNLTNLQRSGNTVTATSAGNFAYDINGLQLTVAGVADNSYNGTFTVTTTAANQFTYTQNGPDSTSTGGTASIVTGSYVLYPMAEVLSVYNTTTRAVDGAMTLGANTVPWAAGDPVEQPHYFQNRMAQDTSYVTQYQPRGTQGFSAGLQFNGVNSSYMNGWSVINNSPVSSYFGNGGTHAVPNAAFVVQGPWTTALDMQAGDSNGILVHCNSHGCGKWNSNYNLFTLQSSQYFDYLNYAPNTSTMTFNMRGTQYSISPTALTAGTINATTINATRINGMQAATASAIGGVTLGARASNAVLSNIASTGDASDLTTGTVAAARLANVPNMVNPVPVPAGGGEYAFTEGSGTVVNDLSGNGNTLQLCSGNNAPTWYSYGLAFLDTGQPQPTFNCAVTPFTKYGTVYFATVSPKQLLTTGTAATYGLPASNGGIVLGFTSYNGSGLNLQTQPGINAFQPTTFGGQGNTVVADGFGGAHVFSFSAGTGSDSLDRWTVDGVEPAYQSQVASAAAIPLTGGATYELGTALNDSGYYWRGVLTYMVVYPGQHTPAQQAAVSRYIQEKLSARGTMPVTTPRVSSREPQFIAAGDSLTASQQGTAQWTSTMGFTNNYRITNNGIAGITAFDVCKLGDAQWAKYIVPGRTVVQFWAGTNDLAITTRNAADVWTSLASCGMQAKRAGARTVVATMIDRDGSGNGMINSKNQLNGLLRANWKSSGAFDALNDLAAVPALGADGASANTSAASTGCFATDKVHLVGPGAGNCATVMVNGSATALSGYGLVAQLTSNAVNTLDGSTQSNPDVSASNAFVESYGNNVVVQTPTAAATHALVDCQGQASPRTVVNGSPSYPITVSGVNGEALTGNATVAPNTSGVFMPMLSGAATGGCSWVRMQ